MAISSVNFCKQYSYRDNATYVECKDKVARLERPVPSLQIYVTLAKSLHCFSANHHLMTSS
jgi:hypothetical protein